jgi:hypothetical protein
MAELQKLYLQDVLAAAPPEPDVTGATRLLTVDMKTVPVSGLPFDSWTRGVYIGSTAPTLVSYAQYMATGTGYFAWLDISAAGASVVNASATIASASGSGAATGITAAVTRYMTATLAAVSGQGSAAAISAAATRYVTATLTQAAGSGTAAPIIAATSSTAVTVTLYPAPGAVIVYTLDGTDPMDYIVTDGGIALFDNGELITTGDVR